MEHPIVKSACRQQRPRQQPEPIARHGARSTAEPTPARRRGSRPGPSTAAPDPPEHGTLPALAMPPHPFRGRVAAARPARFCIRATTPSNRATAGMPAVVPAISTGSSGGSSSHARACACSRATCRAAGFITPFSASQSGQMSVTMCRNFSVCAQCAAYSGSAASGRRCGQIDARAFRFVHQRRQFARQKPGAVGGSRRASFAVHRQDQRGQHRQPLHRRHGRRQVKSSGQRQRRFIQRAQRGDPRQQHRPAIARTQERFGQRAGGAAGRQQNQARG